MQKLQGHAGKSKNQTTKPSNRGRPIIGQDKNEVEEKNTRREFKTQKATQGTDLQNKTGN